MSACDSGSGEVRFGEGVMSLRRGFGVAGAQTFLPSHWPVSDEATSDLMTDLCVDSALASNEQKHGAKHS